MVRRANRRQTDPFDACPSPRHCQGQTDSGCPASRRQVRWKGIEVGEEESGESAMIVKLRRKSTRYRDLTPGHPYVVIGIEADDLRILNNTGRPYLYSSRLFELIDSREPGDWLTEFGEDGETLRISAAAQQARLL